MMLRGGVKVNEERDEINHHDHRNDREGKKQNEPLCFAAGLVLLGEKIHCLLQQTSIHCGQLLC
jgi:hypothetical protein